MIELRGVSHGYDGRSVLSEVDLQVDDGELLLITGRTGSGKSTLLGVLNGLVPQFTGGTLRGDVLIDGVSVLGRAPRELADQVGYVGQDPAAWFVTDTVEEELAFGPEQLGLDQATMRRRVEETLDLLGMADLRRRDLRTLSGGQQQRVAIGAVLTMHPRVLVLDEPTSALDPTAAEDVLAILTRLVHDVGLSVVLAEHRLERVVPFADRIGVLTGDGGFEVGVPSSVLRTAPVAPPIVELGLLAGWDPLPLNVRDARRATRTPCRLGPIGAAPRPAGAASSSLVGAGESPRALTGPVLTAKGVRVSYGHRVAVRRVDIDLAAGTITALMGRNGAGKSSLLWALQGSGPRTAGDVRLAGPASSHRRGGPIGLVPQSPADLLFCESVTQECALADADPGAAAGSPSAQQILDRLAPGIDTALHPRDLSEGQRLALVLALVLRTDPAVVLLDEPTRGLDYPGKAALQQILADLAAQGRSVLVATHDVEFVALVAERVVVLADGEVVADGPTAEVVAQTPAFAPQVSKILGDGWLTVDQVAAELSA